MSLLLNDEMVLAVQDLEKERYEQRKCVKAVKWAQAGSFRREVIVQPQRVVKLAFYKYSSVSKGTELGEHEVRLVGSKPGSELRSGGA